MKRQLKQVQLVDHQSPTAPQEDQLVRVERAPPPSSPPLDERFDDSGWRSAAPSTVLFSDASPVFPPGYSVLYPPQTVDVPIIILPQQ